MRFFQIFLSLFFGFLLVQETKAKAINYFIEIKENLLVLGKYEGEKFKAKRLKIVENNPENHHIIKELLFDNGSENVLYYFHSLYGSIGFYHRNSLQKLNKLGGADKIISIVWHADKKLSYKKSWQKAIHQGEKISPMMLALFQTTKKTNKIICHSMGHRIFEGIVKQHKSFAFKFELIVFAAADLDLDVFNKNLFLLPQISQKIVVYNHEKDRWLKLSKQIHKRKRLGLNAIEKLEILEKIKNLERINVTHSSGKKAIRFSNHIYFKNNKSVGKDLQMLLNNDFQERNNWLTKEAENHFLMF